MLSKQRNVLPNEIMRVLVRVYVNKAKVSNIKLIVRVYIIRAKVCNIK